MNMMKWFSELIWKPIKSHVAFSMMILGGVFIVLGVLVVNSFDALSKILLHSGSAILGGGVFAVILKSAQFTEIFQKHIATVFYDPASLDKHAAIDRWETMTDSLLKEVIPENYAIASRILKEHFLDSDLHYHFEEFHTVHDIDVNRREKSATITNTSKTKLIISPCIECPLLIQDYKISSGSILSMELFLNGSKLDLNEWIDPLKSSETHKFISVNLSTFLPVDCSSSDRVVEFERIIKFKQDLKKEPYIYLNVQRFTKGASIKTKITSGYSVNLVKTGLNNWQEHSETSSTDTNGYQRWNLAEKDFLLLPGQGYILIISQD